MTLINLFELSNILKKYSITVMKSLFMWTSSILITDSASKGVLKIVSIKISNSVLMNTRTF